MCVKGVNGGEKGRVHSGRPLGQFPPDPCTYCSGGNVPEWGKEILK